MSLDKQQDMQAVLESMGEEYGIKFTPEQAEEVHSGFYVWSAYQKYAEISLTSRKINGTKF